MENTFDYVVVGAGSSGCVMANRLSEDGTDTVLILEAGGKDTNMFIHMPCLLYTSPSPRDPTSSRMPSSA